MRVCPQCSMETEASVCPTDGATTIAVHEANPASYEPGTVIAERYRIDGVIGVGGFGAVYRCTQLNMNQTVAVKILRNEHLSSVEHVKRFTREAQAASKLKHPNTIRIFDFGVHDDEALFLAMEFLEGQTFGDRLDAVGTLPWQALVHVMVQVCHSLTEAHAIPLIHRDLKPDNIMLMSVAGDPDFVKVLDFGIAKVQKPGAPDSSALTEAGMIMGTPTYMSPEQARGEDIDARSDVYSLGVMMYEALTGRPPFVGDSPMTVLVAHIKDPPQPMARDGSIPHVPRPVEQVVLRCLEKDPRRRPQTTSELVELLQAASRQAAQPDPVTDLEAEATVGMQGVRTSVLDASSLVSMSTSDGSSMASAPSEPAVPSPPSAHRLPFWIGMAGFGLVALVAVGVAVVATGRSASSTASVAPAGTLAPTPRPASAEPAPPVQSAASPATPAPSVVDAGAQVGPKEPPAAADSAPKTAQPVIKTETLDSEGQWVPAPKVSPAVKPTVASPAPTRANPDPKELPKTGPQERPRVVRDAPQGGAQTGTSTSTPSNGGSSAGRNDASQERPRRDDDFRL